MSAGMKRFVFKLLIGAMALLLSAFLFLPAIPCSTAEASIPASFANTTAKYQEKLPGALTDQLVFTISSREQHSQEHIPWFPILLFLPFIAHLADQKDTPPVKQSFHIPCLPRQLSILTFQHQADGKK